MTPFWDPNFTPPCGQLAAPYLYFCFLRHGGPPPKKHNHCSNCEVPRRTAAMYISHCFIQNPEVLSTNQKKPKAQGFIVPMGTQKET